MSILRDIIEHKTQEIATQKRSITQGVLVQKIETKTRDFLHKLTLPGLSMIAEIKYRSPSGGILPDQRDPVTRAREFEKSGARALSVLTDSRFFNGKCDYIKAVRGHTSLPVLRKEFIIDEYQIYQSRYLGADAILLIVRLLSDHALTTFIKLAGDLNMVALVEVHNEKEIIRAHNAGAQCIGINNRDLDTLTIDIGTCIRLKKFIPEDCVSVAESGIHTREEMQRVETAGFHAVLVGNALASACDTEETVRTLQGRFHGAT